MPMGQKKRHLPVACVFFLLRNCVEEAGLEPAHCLIQNQEPYQFGHSSINPRAPERSRTSNRLIRSQILYPVELRVHLYGSVYGIRTRDLRLERAMSWATRRTRQVIFLILT